MSTAECAVCIYCGCAEANTADHVPPKLLFPLPRPNDLITVPCCRACNSGFQRDDEYLRAALLLRRDIADEPEAQAIMEAFYRSLERPQSYGFGKSFFDTMHRADFQTTGGIYTGPIPAFETSNRRMRRIIERVTRALFYYELGFRVPEDYQTDVLLWVEETPDFLQSMMPFFKNSKGVRQIGGGVFSYVYTVAPQTSATTMWIFRFFGRAIMMGRTIPPPESASPAGVEGERMHR
jgi:hypothetical protein